jgi:hypothetical protein
MEATEKEIYRYLKTHAPCTLKKLITSLCIDPLIIFHSLCTLFEKDKITRLDFSNVLCYNHIRIKAVLSVCRRNSFLYFTF